MPTFASGRNGRLSQHTISVSVGTSTSFPIGDAPTLATTTTTSTTTSTTQTSPQQPSTVHATTTTSRPTRMSAEGAAEAAEERGSAVVTTTMMMMMEEDKENQSESGTTTTLATAGKQADEMEEILHDGVVPELAGNVHWKHASTSTDLVRIARGTQADSSVAPQYAQQHSTLFPLSSSSSSSSHGSSHTAANTTITLGTRSYKLRSPADIQQLWSSQSLHRQRLQSTWNSGCFYAGAKFVGEQRSGRSCYDVSVVLQNVDLKESSACGYLRIKGLTDEFPELTTYFEAEIIGSKHRFLTGKWDATEEVDRQHWIRFPNFAQVAKNWTDEKTQYDFRNRNLLYMRWKEQFLVPDHKVRSINGASFAGFYYICADLTTGTITGYYYHQNSEWFQHLILQHERETSFGSFEFR